MRWLKKISLALETCRAEYAIKVNLKTAERAWEDAQTLAKRRHEDWTMQCEFDRDMKRIEEESK